MSTPSLVRVAIAGLVLAVGAASTAAWAEAPAKSGRTYVIVHGAWGGSWAFRRVAELLEARGHAVYRPSLSGLGERVHLASPSVGLSTHVEDVGNLLVFEGLRDVVLVGHSYGGAVIAGVAEKHPERLRRLVFLDAFVPEDGESVMKMTEVNGRRAWIESMVQGDYVVPSWVKPADPMPRDVPQPLRTFTEPIAIKNPAARRLAGTYILTVDPGATKDNFDFCAERAKARGYGVERMEADHNPQRSAPEALAERLHRID
jgi:pimeloyl-ACP methyl ester carboxylesterase